MGENAGEQNVLEKTFWNASRRARGSVDRGVWDSLEEEFVEFGSLQQVAPLQLMIIRY